MRKFRILYSVLVLFIFLFASCIEEKVKVVDVYTGPYKTTQMKIKMNVNSAENDVNIIFSYPMQASLHWGDGVVEDIAEINGHRYDEKGQYDIQLKGLEENPPFKIENIGDVEEIYWPISNE